MPLRLATILAHPDDETFGTGGTLIRYAREGIEVHSLCLTEGEKGWAGIDDHIVPRELVGPTRAKELAEAGRRMGLASVTCLRYPDSGLADVKEEWVVRDIVRWLRRVRPEVVIIWGPDGGYGHPDHIAAGERALTAIELSGVQRHEPELGAHWHAKRCYRFVAGAAYARASGATVVVGSRRAFRSFSSRCSWIARVNRDSVSAGIRFAPEVGGEGLRRPIVRVCLPDGYDGATAREARSTRASLIGRDRETRVLGDDAMAHLSPDEQHDHGADD